MKKLVLTVFIKNKEYSNALVRGLSMESPGIEVREAHSLREAQVCGLYGILTVSYTHLTCMYYTEMDPLTMEPVYVAKTMEEKKMQRALIHFHKRENSRIVAAALKKAGREDLIPVLSSHKYHTRKHK